MPFHLCEVEYKQNGKWVKIPTLKCNEICSTPANLNFILPTATFGENNHDINMRFKRNFCNGTKPKRTRVQMHIVDNVKNYVNETTLMRSPTYLPFNETFGALTNLWFNPTQISCNAEILQVATENMMVLIPKICENVTIYDTIEGFQKNMYVFQIASSNVSYVEFAYENTKSQRKLKKEHKTGLLIHGGAICQLIDTKIFDKEYEQCKADGTCKDGVADGVAIGGLIALGGMLIYG